MHIEKKKKMTTICVTMSTIQHASDLASVYHAGDEPEPSGKKKTPGLYGSDLKTLMYSDAASIPMLFTDERILVSLESVLQFLFSTAQRLEWSNRRVNRATLVYKDSIIETFSPPSPFSTAAQGKRHDACMANLKRSMLLSVVSGSVLALRGMEMDEEKKSKVHQYAIRAEASLRALVAVLAGWKNGGVNSMATTERAKVPKVMEDAWVACLFYIDGFMCNKERRRVSTEGRACTDSSRIIWSVMEGVYTRINCDLVSPGLDNRMLSCKRLSMREPYGRDSELDDGKNFELLHPCNITLRSLMGYPTIDVMTVEAHKRLGGTTTFHLDPLTNFITGRWYMMANGDKTMASQPCAKASFMGSIPSTRNEALITTIYCGGAATVASGYNPRGPFLGGMEVGPPCAWFPGQPLTAESRDDYKDDYMKGKRELIIWSAVEAGLEEEETNCGPAEWAIQILRGNFMSLFNENEARDASGMMLPTWGANTRVKGMDRTAWKHRMAENFLSMCTAYMHGPVSSCAQRWGVKEDVVGSASPWGKAKSAFCVSLASVSDSQKAEMGKEVCNILKSIHEACSIIGHASSLARMTKMQIIFRSRSHEMMLRFYFISRIQEAVAGIALPKNVLLDDIPCITDSDLRHIFTGDEESLSIVPKLTAWLGTSVRGEERGMSVSSTISKRLARWIVSDMPSKNTGDIGVPETLSASLPYLDRLAIICSIGTAFLCRLASGTLHATYEPTETAWALLSDGVGKEMYEWDSSFVSRLLYNGDESKIWDPSEIDPAHVEWSRRHMEDLLVNHMLKMGSATVRAAADQMESGHVQRFDTVMENHLAGKYHSRVPVDAVPTGCDADELSHWFTRHMHVYGGVYAGVYAGMCQ